MTFFSKIFRSSNSPLNILSKTERKIVRAWCMYDWANSGFYTSVVVAIMPVYFVSLYKDEMGSGTVLGGFQFSASVVWALTGALATFIVALSSPIFGIIADKSGLKKRLLTILCTAGSFCTLLLFLSDYTSTPWLFTLAFYFLAAIGFAGANVFYNSLLPHIAPEDLLDDVSSRGYAYGYLGGGLLLLVHVIFLIFFDYSDLAIRSCIASTGLWTFGWAIWTILVVPEPSFEVQNSGKFKFFRSVSLAFKQLKNTAREFKQFKTLLIFLLAFIIFNDAIQTALGIAGAFGLDVLRISAETNILTILIVQFVATPGAMFFAYLAKKIGTKKSLIIAVLGWGFIIILAVGFAPLNLSEHTQYDYQLNYDKSNDNYQLLTKPTLSDTNKNEIYWADQNSDFINKDILSLDQANLFIQNFELQGCRFSVSISGGSLDTLSSVCDTHPSKLNENFVDLWPTFLRMVLWAPLGFSQDMQFILLGISVGIVMGGSQALGRSMFAYMVPKSRSGEFFGFFSFSWRAVSVIGPVTYALLAGFFTPRIGIASLGIQIFIGVIILKFVNVEDGRKVALEHDQDKYKI
jgi:UMF1 family MFS transporter